MPLNNLLSRETGDASFASCLNIQNNVTEKAQCTCGVAYIHEYSDVSFDGAHGVDTRLCSMHYGGVIACLSALA